jgi:uncharacterized membrane protein YeaQ/YmgE (transglycosylase-associated protein family)
MAAPEPIGIEFREEAGEMSDRTNIAALAAVPVIAQAGDRASLDLGTILFYVLIGAVIGVIARLLIPGTGGMGLVVTIVVGILGAVIGGWLAGEVFEETEGVDWIASILVAAILVFIASRVMRGRGTAPRRRAL